VIAAEILFYALAAASLVPASILFIQVLMALPAAARRPAMPSGRRPTLAVLMPAHNEASVIVDSIRSVMPQLAAGDRLLVVADNCSDDTASVAAAAGALVAERRDPARPGKNYALEFGVRQLEANPPEVVIIVDADCRVHEAALDRLARSCGELGRPVQSIYLMMAPEGAGLAAEVAAFAWIVKNWVRPLGMQCMGLPCQLMGTGTAFPWRAIAGFRIANNEMAEDYKFGIDMALAGDRATFRPVGTFTSYFPATRRTADIQRTRWEHGHLHLIQRSVPRLLLRAARRGDRELFGLALDLLVPPLSFLALGLALSSALTFLYLLASGDRGPLLACAGALAMFTVAVATAWCGWGRKAIPFASLAAVPLYVLQKIPIYVRYLTRRQRVWIKTTRD
jgi:cellulose synthase/poly-beta-1,6-N-acetylglucosamine synthase-like glycosyltransferase